MQSRSPRCSLRNAAAFLVYEILMRHIDDEPRHDQRRNAPDDVPVGRILGSGEDPLSFTIPLGTWAGVRVGLWAVFPIWIIAELVATLPQDRIGLPHMAIGVARMRGQGVATTSTASTRVVSWVAR